jgi:hypothetical protein
MATETKIRFTEEQKEAWKKAKKLLKSTDIGSVAKRSLHIAMSELRAEQGRKHKGPIETLAKKPGKLEQYQAGYRNNEIAARVQDWKTYLQDPGARKLYIIVRDDLSPAQKAVQASHCAAEFQKRHPLAPWVNGTMVLLQNNPSDPYFKRFAQVCTAGRIEADPFEHYIRNAFYRAHYTTLWREPDMGNKLTAVAVLSSYQNELNGKTPGIKLV